MFDFLCIHVLPLLLTLFAMGWYPCCCGGTCDCCSDDDTPDSFQVTFSSVQNGSPITGCQTCADLNSTSFVLARNEASGDCYWSYSFDDEDPCPCDPSADPGSDIGGLRELVLTCTVEGGWKLVVSGYASIGCIGSKTLATFSGAADLSASACDGNPFDLDTVVESDVFLCDWDYSSASITAV